MTAQHAASASGAECWVRSEKGTRNPPGTTEAPEEFSPSVTISHVCLRARCPRACPEPVEGFVSFFRTLTWEPASPVSGRGFSRAARVLECCHPEGLQPRGICCSAFTPEETTDSYVLLDFQFGQRQPFESLTKRARRACMTAQHAASASGAECWVRSEKGTRSPPGTTEAPRISVRAVFPFRESHLSRAPHHIAIQHAVSTM